MINAVCKLEPCYSAWANAVESDDITAGQAYCLIKTLKQSGKNLNILFDNDALVKHNNFGSNEKSFAVLNESPVILEFYHKYHYKLQGTFYDSLCELMSTRTNGFSTLYTFDKRYADLPNTVIVPRHSDTFIRDKSRIGLHYEQKNNLLTFITSKKRCTMEQHIRVNLANWLISNGISVYGKDFCPIKCKSDVLKNSMFCYVIENGIYRGYHTEKVLDCFLTGCVPIYMGDPDISDYFDTNGMIICKTERELYEKANVTPEMYQKMLPYVKKNFEIASKYYNTNTFEPILAMMYAELFHLK